MAGTRDLWLLSQACYRLRYATRLSMCLPALPKLKENMLGVRFEDLDEVEDAGARAVRLYERRCLATGKQKLPSKWRSVTEHKGRYSDRF